MNKLIRQFEKESGLEIYGLGAKRVPWEAALEKYAELIVAECIDKIETYRIPVGNSSSGELACEWTYSALKEIRDEIREHFAVEEPKGWVCPKCNADRTKTACPLGFGATVDGRCPMTMEAQ
jgi:hypothetical protein